MLLGDDLSVELVLGDLLLGELLVAPGLELLEAELNAARLAAIEPDRHARQVLQESAVVADQNERAALLIEARFEPFDRRQIEMIGGLVEQQDIGHGRQGARERGTAHLAAREMRGVLVAAQAELLQEIARLMQVVGRSEAGLDVGERRRIAAEIGLLRHVADRRARLHEALAAIGLDLACGNPQQCRLAGAVAADKADALTGRDGEVHALEQGGAAKGQGNVAQLNEGWGHAARGRCRSVTAL